MALDDYNDYSGSSSSRGKSSSKVGILALLCILILLVCVCVAMILIPSGKKDVVEKDAPIESVVSVESVSTVSVEKVESTNELVVEVVKEEPKVVKEVPSTTTARDIVQAREEVNPNRIHFSDHVVLEGEDLNKIASQYGLKVQTLISVNKIRNIAGITPGVHLQVPDRDGQLYIVQNGDMLSTIARKFNPEMGWKQLQELNGLKSENIFVGQELFIPDAIQVATLGVVTASSLTFSKPVAGSITASFGQLVDGASLNGVYITGPAGSAVKAACKGSVIEASRTSRLGRYVILQHDEGYRTTYAYLESVNVKSGQEIEEGAILGSIGLSSHKTEEPVLYFILEQSGIALDPNLFF